MLLPIRKRLYSRCAVPACPWCVLDLKLDEVPDPCLFDRLELQLCELFFQGRGRNYNHSCTIGADTDSHAHARGMSCSMQNVRRR